MERKIVITKDGSHTVVVPEMNIIYRSLHGAIQESKHVFIEAGLRPVIVSSSYQQVSVLEMGLGTGLNALLTLLEADLMKQNIHYTAIEPYPLSNEEIRPLNYCEQLERSYQQVLFEQLHDGEWEKDICLTSFFTIHKIKKDLLHFSTDQLFNLIYFDAFAPTVQPELWTREIFDKMFSMLTPGGVLVTYCSKGDVRRNMIAAGFEVEKLSGPPGKREMLRGKKVSES